MQLKSIILFSLCGACAFDPGTWNDTGSASSALLSRQGVDPVSPLAGTASLDDLGHASYVIPLTVPPGRRGLAPSLALTYSSGAGDGHLGQGFELAGAHSRIHRCAKSIEPDGLSSADPGGVRFATSDRLCLDGARLIGPGADDAYWAEGARLEEELAAWRRIELRKAPELHFIVHQRDGSRRVYGQGSATVRATRSDRDSSGARTGSATVEVEWRLRRVEDAFGNYVEFEYKHADFADGAYEHLLDVIRYTGGPGLSPQREVRLVYQERTSASSFVGGTEQRITQLIERVELWVRGTKARSYNFLYKTDSWSLVPILETVTECGPLGRCRPPTHFDWSEPTWTTDLESVMPAPDEWFEAANPDPQTTMWSQLIESGDLNGDSRDDLVYWRRTPGSVENRLKARFRQSDGAWSVETDLGYAYNVAYGDLGRMFEVVPSIDSRARLLLRRDARVGDAWTAEWDLMAFDAGGLSSAEENVLGEAHHWESGRPGNVVAADANGDGAPDVLGLVNREQERLSRGTGSGRRSTSRPTGIATPSTSASVTSRSATSLTTCVACRSTSMATRASSCSP